MRRLAHLLTLLWLSACSRGAPSPSDAVPGSAPGSARTPTSSACPPCPSGGAPIASAAVDAGAASSACACAAAPPTRDEPWLARTLRATDPALGRFFDEAETLRLEILVTVIEPGGVPAASYGFRVDAEYFYPASAIKTFLAVAALRAMSQRAGGDISPATRIMRCRDDRPDCEPPKVDEDEQAEAEAEPDAAPEPVGPDGERKKKHKKLRVGEELRKLLSFSDNDSYNRFFDIVGHRELNQQMAELGFGSVRFHHRMDTPAERSRKTLRVLLLPPGKRAIDIPLRKSTFDPPPTPAPKLEVGQAYNDGGKRVDEPLSFARKNYVSLRELQLVNRALLFPAASGTPSLGLSDEQRALLVAAMTAKLDSPRHAAEHFPLSPGVLEVLPAERVRIVGKSGRAYGFHLDNSFIEDRQTGRGLLVTATVYANPDGVLNDDDYGYDEISRPLLRALGAALCRELLSGKPLPPGE